MTQTRCDICGWPGDYTVKGGLAHCQLCERYLLTSREIRSPLTGDTKLIIRTVNYGNNLILDHLLSLEESIRTLHGRVDRVEENTKSKGETRWKQGITEYAAKIAQRNSERSRELEQEELRISSVPPRVPGSDGGNG